MTSKEFIKYYEKYLIGDIDAMMEKADQESKGNQMAVPITFSIFSCLDIIGYLIRNTKDDCKLLKDTTVNIATSLLWSNFGFPEFDIKKVHDLNMKNRNNQAVYVEFRETLLFKFIDIYRNGIMHTFFPKEFSISNKKENESYELFYKSGDKVIFNVRKFYSYFKNFIKEFKKELSTNKDFNNHIEENINLVFKKNNSFDDFYENITKIEKFSHSFCPTTTVETTPSPNQAINSEDVNITGSLG